MQLGISTASYFNRLHVEDALDNIAAHGVSLCEVFLNSFCEYSEAFEDVLAARVKANGLSVYSVHPMSTQFEPQLFSLLDRQRADARQYFERVLQLAKRLGARCYVMHGPVRLAGAAKNIQLDRIAPIFSELSDCAAGYGVTLALENVSYCLFNHPSFCDDMRARIGDKLKYTLDVKQAVRSGFEPADFAAAMGRDAVNFHLCDAAFSAGGAFTLKMPPLGNADFAGIARRLLDCGYQGPAFVEVYSDMYASLPALYESSDALADILGATARICPAAR